MIASSLVVECCDDLTRLHRITVFYQECAEATGRPGGQFGKLLHDLDQSDHGIGADLPAFLDELETLSRIQAEQKGLYLHFDRDGDMPQYCDACFSGDYPTSLTDHEEAEAGDLILLGERKLA